jgi:hypothetical protein
MDFQEPQSTDVHSLIAGRLLWDPHFITSLMENPRQAIIDTLVKGGVEPDDMLVNDLMAELEDFEGRFGYDNLIPAANNHMLKGPSADMV